MPVIRTRPRVHPQPEPQPREVTSAPDDATTDGGVEAPSASPWRASAVPAGRVTDHARSRDQSGPRRSAHRRHRPGCAHPAAHVLFRLRGCAASASARCATADKTADKSRLQEHRAVGRSNISAIELERRDAVLVAQTISPERTEWSELAKRERNEVSQAGRRGPRRSKKNERATGIEPV
jgi:hypothetical protein